MPLEPNFCSMFTSNRILNLISNLGSDLIYRWEPSFYSVIPEFHWSKKNQKPNRLRRNRIWGIANRKTPSPPNQCWKWIKTEPKNQTASQNFIRPRLSLLPFFNLFVQWFLYMFDRMSKNNIGPGGEGVGGMAFAHPVWTILWFFYYCIPNMVFSLWSVSIRFFLCRLFLLYCAAVRCTLDRTGEKLRGSGGTPRTPQLKKGWSSSWIDSPQTSFFADK